MSRRNKDKGRIEGPFIPILISTRKSAAWRALSPYAREVYHSLRSRYNSTMKNNGRVYLSARDGAEETGFKAHTVARSLRELKHYGFIVMMEAGCLGVEGRGKAPHWRLTELGYMGDPPTRDFLKWDGEIFHEQKSPAHYKRKERSLAKLRKQNPVPLSGTDCAVERHIPLCPGAAQLSEEVCPGAAHTNDNPCAPERHISRFNHSLVPEVSGAASAADPVPGWVAWLPAELASLAVLAFHYADLDRAAKVFGQNLQPQYLED
jgi:hypothetical protein